MSTDFGEEKKTARERLLDLLSDGEWHSYKECQSVGGARYGARLHELRRLGFQVDSRGDKAAGLDYRVTGTGEPQRKRVKVYLEEEDVIELLDSHRLTTNARKLLEEALGSFRHNKDKL
jgi:hypothetical protein